MSFKHLHFFFFQFLRRNSFLGLMKLRHVRGNEAVVTFNNSSALPHSPELSRMEIKIARMTHTQMIFHSSPSELLSLPLSAHFN